MAEGVQAKGEMTVCPALRVQREIMPLQVFDEAKPVAVPEIGKKKSPRGEAQGMTLSLFVKYKKHRSDRNKEYYRGQSARGHVLKHPPKWRGFDFFRFSHEFVQVP